jgi:hypothetical protein
VWGDSAASGSLAMIQPAWRYVSGSEDYGAGELYQTSLMSALLAGVYVGEMTYGEIRKHGDLGLGTFNELDGEMVRFEGTFHQLRSDGSARPVTPDQKTPFAVVTFFKAEKDLDLPQPMTKTDLLALIEKATVANLFTAVRVDGTFDEVRTRTVTRQSRLVARKMLYFDEVLWGLSRIDFQMGVSAMAHDKMLRSIEIPGTRVAPIVRKELGTEHLNVELQPRYRAQ